MSDKFTEKCENANISSQSPGWHFQMSCFVWPTVQKPKDSSYQYYYQSIITKNIHISEAGPHSFFCHFCFKVSHYLTTYPLLATGSSCFDTDSKYLQSGVIIILNISPIPELSFTILKIYFTQFKNITRMFSAFFFLFDGNIPFSFSL